MKLSPSEFTREAIRLAALQSGHVGADVETDGLSVRKGSKAFVLGFTTEQGERFCVRLSPELKPAVRLLFSNPRLKYCFHNAKFELGFLRHQFETEVRGVVWDTEVFARVEQNNHLSYSLQKCAERIGLTKHAAMIEWLKIRGNKGNYHLAPPEIIEPYVEQDAWLSWELARRQMITFRHWDVSTPVQVGDLVRLELETTRHLFEMEDYGLLVDVNYCQRALEYEHRKIAGAKKAFEDYTGVEFVDSRKTLAPVFDAAGIRYGKTDLGNASFTEESLKGQERNPQVRALLDYRNGKKRASSYWENFLELEHNGIINPNINQNRAATGRMSISEPSCQNWPTDEDDPAFPIRRAFVARPGCLLFSLDYSAMELRFICDAAGDMGMIAAIQSGVDFHQQVADAASVPRSLAKNGRFAKLYGAGIPKVAQTLGISEALARSISDAIDASSPRVAAYSRELTRYAERNPYGYDFLGRRFYFDRGFAYKLSNYSVQGGCGEVLRLAIRAISRFLQSVSERLSPDTRMILPVHDELVFNVYKQDVWIMPAVKQLMIDAYTPIHGLKMDVNITSGANYHDQETYVVSSS